VVAKEGGKERGVVCLERRSARLDRRLVGRNVGAVVEE